MRRSLALVALSVVVGVALVFPALQETRTAVGAESAKSKSGKSSNTKELDVRAAQLEESFIKESAELARSYQEAGHLEKAKSMLQTLKKLNPEIPGVDARLKALNEEILTANESDLEVDTTGGWGKPCGLVYKGKPIKIRAVGEYRFVTNLTVGPDGFPTEDSVRDMAADVPCGALMGLILPKGKSGKPAKPSKPFAIGAGKTVSPKEDGVLFLKVNVPSGHKCNGRLKVRLSGYIGTS